MDTAGAIVVICRLVAMLKASLKKVPLTPEAY